MKRSIFGQSEFCTDTGSAGGNTVGNNAGQIDAANKKREQLEKERTELKKTLSSSESKKDNILQYITTLDKKMDTLTDKVKSNEEQIQLVQSTIDELLLQEAQVTAKMSSQYETMKERIKYMYEDGTSGYLELLAGPKQFV